MVIFSFIALLFIALMYALYKVQSLHKQLALQRTDSQQLTRQYNQAFAHLLTHVEHFQITLCERLEITHQKALLNHDQYNILKVLFSSYRSVIMKVCEKEFTVEQALSAVLTKHNTTMEQLQDCVKDLPADIRTLWSKNTVDSFSSACDKISRLGLKANVTDSTHS